MSAAIFVALLGRLALAGVVRWMLVTLVVFVALVTKDPVRHKTDRGPRVWTSWPGRTCMPGDGRRVRHAPCCRRLLFTPRGEHPHGEVVEVHDPGLAVAGLGSDAFNSSCIAAMRATVTGPSSSTPGMAPSQCLLGTTVTWHERGTWASWPEFVDAAMARERAAGERPYLVPPSLSAWPGLLGSIDLGLELAAQMPDDGRAVSVVAPAGSGGTCLGLAIAARALSRPWTIYGVCFGGPSAATTTSLVGLRRDVADRLGGAADAPVVLHDASGAGYDRPQPAELDVMRLCLSRYRSPVDPTYMAKTVIGLQELIGRGAIAAGSRVVRSTTGGNLGVFNDSAAVEAWASDALAHYLR